MGILSLYRAGSRRKTRFLHNNTRGRASVFSLNHHPLDTHFFHGLLVGGDLRCMVN